MMFFRQLEQRFKIHQQFFLFGNIVGRASEAAARGLSPENRFRRKLPRRNRL
jgi:hypothetical protein